MKALEYRFQLKNHTQPPPPTSKKIHIVVIIIITVVTIIKSVQLWGTAIGTTSFGDAFQRENKLQYTPNVKGYSCFLKTVWTQPLVSTEKHN